MCGIVCIIGISGSITLVKSAIETIRHRGPDGIRTHNEGNVYFGFSRLSIRDPSEDGMQPFISQKTVVICNGEIYNYEELVEKYGLKDTLKSHSDCEILTHIYEKVGFTQLIAELDAEFALIVHDKITGITYAARDRYGVRPLFIGTNKDNKSVCLASELKAIDNICETIIPLRPDVIFSSIQLDNHESIDVTYTGNTIYNYPILHMPKSYVQDKLFELLTSAVKKRLISDRPIGFLLSGGLDSSLIVAIACKILGPDKITCFTIGLPDSSDVIASKKVVEYLGIQSHSHHIVPFDIDTAFSKIPDVIRAIESYDITTIRASVPQYMMADYISKNTNIKVLLSGEGSDEIHGSYRYFRDAPDINSFHNERIRLLKELYLFDNLRTDRTMAAFGLEVRVPFLDLNYVDHICCFDEFLMNDKNTIEKLIVREAFNGYLPADIMYRPKEAFSDAVSSADVSWYKSVQQKLGDIEESQYYKQVFKDSFIGNRLEVIPHYWLPKFQKKVVTDPSATVLDCY